MTSAQKKAAAKAAAATARGPHPTPPIATPAPRARALPAVLNIPAKVGDEWPRAVHPSSKRAMVIAALKAPEGVTYPAGVQALVLTWSLKNAHECLRILHNRYGYGFKLDPGTMALRISVPE